MLAQFALGERVARGHYAPTACINRSRGAIAYAVRIAAALSFERAQMDAFEERDSSGHRMSREQWLRSTFSMPIHFDHRKQQFYYVPFSNPDPTIIIGRIRRQVNVQENEPPSAGLEDTIRETWQASYLFVDPRHHADGQKVALEHNHLVGLPIPLFKSLTDQLNRRDPPSLFLVEVSPISDAGDFWQFVHENKGDITSVEFELVVPNMFDTESDLQTELRDMRERERARRVRFQIENRDGLELETNRIKHAVDYASRGGGAVKARTKKSKKFNSKARAQRVSVSEIDLPSPQDFLRRVVSIILKP